MELLNDDLQQLCDYNGVHVRNLRHTLPNLRRLILHFQTLTQVSQSASENGHLFTPPTHTHTLSLLLQKLTNALPSTPSVPSGTATPDATATSYYSSSSSTVDQGNNNSAPGNTPPLGAFLIRDRAQSGLYSA